MSGKAFAIINGNFQVPDESWRLSDVGEAAGRFELRFLHRISYFS